MLAKIYAALAHTYRLWGEPYWARAESYLEASLEISEHLGDLGGVAKAKGNLGLLFHLRGRWRDAERLMRQSLEINRIQRSADDVAAVCYILGRLLAMMGRGDEAEEILLEGLAAAKQIDMPIRLVRYYERLADARRLRGDRVQAGDYLEQALDLCEARSLPNDVSARISAELRKGRGASR
jgi:tetratricopeptide (TPR) repeat protein